MPSFSFNNLSGSRTWTLEFNFNPNRTNSNPSSPPPMGLPPETIRVNFNGKRVRETTPLGNFTPGQPHESSNQTLYQRIVRLFPFAREVACTPCLDADIDLDDDDTTSEKAPELTLPFPQLPFTLPLVDGQEISVKDFHSLYLWACTNDNVEVIKQLAQAVPSSTFMRLTTTGAGEGPTLNAFARAAISGNEKVLSYLCAAFPDARKQKQEALHWAVKHKQSRSVEILCIKGNANPNALYPDGQTALQISMELTDTSTMSVLLSAGADVNKFYNDIAKSYFYKAFKQGNNDVIRTLISAVQDVNKSISKGGIRLLHLAAWSGNLEIIDHLIERNARINQSTGWRNGRATPMHFAALESHQQAMFKLIDNGGNLYAGKANIDGFFWCEEGSYSNQSVARQNLFGKMPFCIFGGTPLELCVGTPHEPEAESQAELQASLKNYMEKHGKSS